MKRINATISDEAHQILENYKKNNKGLKLNLSFYIDELIKIKFGGK